MMNFAQSPILGYAYNLEPETIAVIARFTTAPNLIETLDYNDLIIDLKNTFGLSLGVSNLSTKLDVLYVNAAHDKQAQTQNFARNAFNKTEVGTVTFTQFVGIKSASSSYYATNYSDTSSSNRLCFGSYLVDAVDNANYTLGRSDNLARGIRLSFSNTNLGYPDRGTTATSVVSIGTKRHIMLCGGSGFGTNAFQYVNGSLAATVVANARIGGAVYELCNNANGTAASFFTNNIAFTYFGVTSVELSTYALGIHNAFKSYLTKKGITGL